MAERLILHVGLMKSGTSFIQQVLKTNKAELEERGVLYAGRRWRYQVEAVRDIIGHGGAKQPPLEPDGAWRTLMDEVDAWSGTAVISMEFLAARKAPKIRDVIAHLPVTEVQVVISVRDVIRSIPAMWQENIQNGGRYTFDEYLAGVWEEDKSTAGPGRAFWSRQEFSRITRLWMNAAGRDHVTVLTVPQRGAPPATLWERFASIIPVDPSGLDLDVRSNPSLGLPSLLMLRQLNLRLAELEEPIDKDEYGRTVKQMIAKRGLVARADEPKLGLDAPWVAERAALEVQRLRDLEPQVVGDLDELLGAPIAGIDPSQVPLEDQLAAALDALALVTERLARQ